MICFHSLWVIRKELPCSFQLFSEVSILSLRFNFSSHSFRASKVFRVISPPPSLSLSHTYIFTHMRTRTQKIYCKNTQEKATGDHFCVLLQVTALTIIKLTNPGEHGYNLFLLTKLKIALVLCWNGINCSIKFISFFFCWQRLTSSSSSFHFPCWLGLCHFSHLSVLFRLVWNHCLSSWFPWSGVLRFDITGPPHQLGGLQCTKNRFLAWLQAMRLIALPVLQLGFAKWNILPEQSKCVPNLYKLIIWWLQSASTTR